MPSSTVLMVPADGGSPPGVILDSVTGATLFKNPAFISRSPQVGLSTDLLFAMNTSFSGADDIKIFQWNGDATFTQVGIFSALGTTIIPYIAAVGVNFWVLAGFNGLNFNTPSFVKFDKTGAVLAGPIGPITFITNGDGGGFCVSNDETIGYYSNGLDNAPIHRWDLVNNVALSNLVANLGGANIATIGMWPIVGSTDIVTILEDTDAVTTNSRIIRRYTAAGAIVYSNTFAALGSAGSVDPLAEVAMDPSFTSLWVRFPGPPDYDPTIGPTRIQQLRISDGVSLGFVDVPLDPIDFSPAATCPLIALQAPSTSTLTVIKVIDPVGDVTTVFPYTTTGGLSPSAFTLVGGASRVFSGVPAGVYGVEETPPVGWLLESVVVSSGDPAGAIVLAGGNAVTVTFTNKIIKLPVPGLLMTGKMHVYGYAEQPGSTLGLAPGARIDIFNQNAPHHQGLGVKVESSQPLGNPFVADKNGYYSAYVVPEPIDLQSAGDGVDPPERYSDVLVLDPRIQSLQNSLLAIQQSMATLVAGASGQVNQVRNIATGLSLGGSLTVGVR